MKIKKLNEKKIDIKLLYEYFINSNSESEDLFVEEYYDIEEIICFPIYIAKGSEEEKNKEFLEGFNIIKENYLYLGKDITLDKIFWYSLFLNENYREYIIKKYPLALESEKDFNNIVLKKFDWENYVYKMVLGADYVNEEITREEHDRYFEIICNNLDVYNYVLKSELFRNSKFMKNILDVIDKNNISNELKKKIIDPENPRLDKRVGREIISSLSQSYPSLFVHDLEYESFEELFLSFYKTYDI